MKITDHILEGVNFRQTPNVWQLPIAGPKFLILHYSMSGNVAGTVAHLTNPASKVSAHIVIGRDGEVVQLAGFDKRCWHCGPSSWGGLTQLNYYAVGIEFVNWGPVEMDKDGKFWTKWMQEVPADEVEQATHKNESSPRYWQKYTPEQLKKGAEIARAILATYPTIEAVLGHDDIAPTRKIDPGPLFPMDQFLVDCGFMDAPEPQSIFEVNPLHFERSPFGGVDVILSYKHEDDAPVNLMRMTQDEARALRDWLNQNLPE